MPKITNNIESRYLKSRLDCSLGLNGNTFSCLCEYKKMPKKIITSTMFFILLLGISFLLPVAYADTSNATNQAGNDAESAAQAALAAMKAAQEASKEISTQNDQTAQPQTVDNQTAPVQTVDNQTPKSQTVNNQTAQSQTADTPTSQQQTIQSQTVDNKTAQVQTVNNQTAQLQTTNEVAKTKDDANLISKLKELPRTKGSDTSPISPEKLDRAEKIKLLKAKIEKNKNIRVIVGVNSNFKPEKELSLSQIKEQRKAIKSTQDSLMGLLASNMTKDVYKFEGIPLMVMNVDKKTLEKLEASPLAAEIYEDELVHPLITDSVPLIGAPLAWSAGYTGAGQTIAILDTGVDKTHPFLTGKVVSEACYSTTSGGSTPTTSVCPGGVAETTAVGSGIQCSLSECYHGTHVAGIAAGKGTSFSGVAKDANIISIQVFSKVDSTTFCGTGFSPCLGAFTSDIIKGLQRVITLAPSYSISSVNLSLGGGAVTSACDADLRKPSVDSLKALGIATVAAAGNGNSFGIGYTNALTSPACITNVVSVGSTTVNSHGSGLLNDKISSFSNTASFLDLLAPGEVIQSSTPGGTFGLASGTSQATPHVSGAWAVLKQSQPNASVDQILNVLRSTGLQITHPTSGLTFPRIQVANALGQLNSPIAVDDSGTGFITDEDSSFTTANVKTNDSDPNGDTLSVNSFDTTGTLGLVTNNGDGTFGYNPNGKFEGLSQGQTATDTFTYTISDGHGFTDTATVSITINGITDVPSPPGNWINTSWQYRKHITVDSNQVNSDLTDFPLLVRVTDIDLKNKALSNGNDILFTAADGITKLSHEIEKYDGTTGELVAWVKIPIVSGATDTSVFMYYGNAAATNQQDITGTWNSNYKAVSHLSSNFLDSTSNHNDGTNSGTVASSGIIGGASSFNGINNYVQLANEANFDFERTNTSTLSAWFISNDGTGCGELIGKMGASPYNGYDMIICNGQVYSELVNNWPSNALRENTNSAAFGDGTWHYGVITYDGSSSPTGLKTYIDGIEQTTTTTHNTLTSSILQNIAVRYGERSNGDAPLAGKLDEARVSAAVHSADWINAEFNNQKMSSNFIALGTEETSGPPPSPIAPSPITDLSAAPGDAKVTLSWSAPFNGGSPITDYIIEYKQTANPTYAVFTDGTSTSTTAMVTGLVNGISYDFKVKAVNSVGQAPDSNVATTTPQAPIIGATYVKRQALLTGSTVFCDSGDVATGGGFTGMLNIAILFTNAPVISSGQLSNNGQTPTGWKIEGFVLDPFAEAFVICDNVTP